MKGAVYIETHEEEGCVYIRDEHATLARTKSRTVACQIRDALNAPNPLVGRRCSRFGALQHAVIQAVGYSHDGRFRLLVLTLPDNRLETWDSESVELTEAVYRDSRELTDEA